MNVLSLFDGMSCGQIALERAGVKIAKYFASEIDKNAIKVTQDNYPNTIQLGDVTKVNGNGLPSIDLLIGGSPCQGFSFAGKQLNFEDPRSKLFFEFVRLKDDLLPTYFFLENVRMQKEYQDIITEMLGVTPVEVNSSLVSGQDRKRIYWTNIEGFRVPKDKNIILEQVLDLIPDESLYIDQSKVINTRETKNYLQYDMNGTGHASQSQRARYIHAKAGCLDTRAATGAKVFDSTNRVRRYSRNEGERLQTVPEDYTKSVDRKYAMHMLGNGWTVDVIVEFFKNLK